MPVLFTQQLWLELGQQKVQHLGTNGINLHAVFNDEVSAVCTVGSGTESQLRNRHRRRHQHNALSSSCFAHVATLV